MTVKGKIRFVDLGSGEWYLTDTDGVEYRLFPKDYSNLESLVTNYSTALEEDLLMLLEATEPPDDMVATGSMPANCLLVSKAWVATEV